MGQTFSITLCGMPNTGKSELFNALTNSNERTGNFSGVTVEQTTGCYTLNDSCYNVIDLPGLHTLVSRSTELAMDTAISSNYLLNHTTSLLVNVVNASQLKRHLFLTTQLRQLDSPMILVVNMLDIADKKGLCINFKSLQKKLGCPVVGINAKKNEGIDTLKEVIESVTHNPESQPNMAVELPHHWEQSFDRLSQHGIHPQPYWITVNAHLGNPNAFNALPESVQNHITQWQKAHSKDDSLPISDAFYTKATSIAKACTFLNKGKRKQLTRDWLDNIVLHRVWGIPIFLFVIYLMFVFSINIGGAFQDFFDLTSRTIFVDGTNHLLHMLHAPDWLIGILANGLGQGLNTVITFTPVIAAMFLFLAFLEDSGYLSRAAFVMDRVMQKLGLPGQSFIPMMVGFGCNVPAVMGSRTLKTPRDRILTILMTPFMSCGARLAIFAVFASAFFPHGGQNIIFLLYMTGLVAAIGTGTFIRKVLLPGQASPLILELPDYHLPTFRSIRRLLYQRLSGFLWRAGRLIVPICLLIGSLNAIELPTTSHETGPKTVLAQVGQTMTPLFAPLGIQADNWPATVGLLTGILAKEVVVGTLNTLYSAKQSANQTALAPYHPWQTLKLALNSIPENLSNLNSAFKNPFAASEAEHDMTPRAVHTMIQQFVTTTAAFSYLIFVLLYFPCISTLGAMRREIPTSWCLFSIGWSTWLAFSASIFVYQSTLWTIHPMTAILWQLGIVMGFISCAFLLKKAQNKGLFPTITTTPINITVSPCGGCQSGCSRHRSPL